MNDEVILRQAADELYRAQHSGYACSPIRHMVPSGQTYATAYAIQEINTRRGLASGRRLFGRKIGLASVATRKPLRLNQPGFGMLFDDMQVPNRARLLLDDFIQPKVSANIAFVMKAPLENRVSTPEEIIGATEYVCTALEIVDSRIAHWDIDLFDAIADNASSGMFILSDERHPLSDFDRFHWKMVMRWCNCETVSTGSAVDCDLSPLDAASWLARRMIELGRPLLAGDCILVGPLGPMVAVRPGDSYVVSINGLGNAAVIFD